jgi:hypothetical protein
MLPSVHCGEMKKTNLTEVPHLRALAKPLAPRLRGCHAGPICQSRSVTRARPASWEQNTGVAGAAEEGSELGRVWD